MNFRGLIHWLLFILLALTASAEDQAAATAAHDNTTTAAAAVVTTTTLPRTPSFLEHLVDAVLERFDVKTSENTAAHYVIAALFLVGALLLRRVLTTFVFNRLKKLAARTQSTLDDKLFPALEAPATTFVMLAGIFCALRVLKFSEINDRAIGYGITVAFSLNLFWALLAALDALLDHFHEVALEKQMGVAAFMPWIKKALVAMFVVLGVLLTVQSLGYNVSTILSGLGIGGLAFALAAQDTIANLFGSIVVAIDQPFKIGETVKIGASQGLVEDIGLRSTKIRLTDRSLVIIPNKTVSSEAIVNLSRFTSRRVEQVLSLTYDTRPEQMEAVVTALRALINAEPGIDQTQTTVYFRDLSASSLDIWVAYVAADPDFARHMELRQRLNLGFMRTVAAHKLEFAFPTSVMHLDGPIAKQIAGKQG